MTFFSKSLSKVLQPNPIAGILEVIPYTDHILDPKLLDLIKLELLKVGVTHTTNSALMLLLVELDRAGLVTLTCYEYPSTLGQLFIIKRNT